MAESEIVLLTKTFIEVKGKVSKRGEKKQGLVVEPLYNFRVRRD